MFPFPPRASLPEPPTWPSSKGFLCLAAAFLAATSLPAEDDKPLPPDHATRHEIWVPSKQLSQVLKDHPNAVLLSPAEYEELIRQAGQVKPEDDTPDPPETPVIENAHLSADVTAGSTVLILKARLSLYHFRNGWGEFLLPELPSNLKLLHTDGKNIGVQGENGRFIAMHGKGRHEVELEFQVPIKREHGVCQAEIPLLARPLSVSLRAGEKITLPTRWPVQNGVTEAPLVAENPKGHSAVIYWVETDPAAVVAPALFEDAICFSLVEGVQVMTQLRLTVASTQGVLPEVLRFQLPDDAVHVVKVHEENIASWSQKGQVLEIHRTSGLSVRREFMVELTRPTPDAGEVTPVTLDIPRLEGATHVSANIAFAVGQGLETTAWQTPGSALYPVMLDQIKSMIKQDLPKHSGIYYDVAPEKIVAQVRRLADRYSADVDARILIGSHEVTVSRALAFHGEEGSTRRAEFTLAEGEQFLRLEVLSGQAAEWKQTGERTFELTWPYGLAAGQATSLLLQTRQEVSVPASEGKSVDKLTFTNIHLPAASRLAGYVALAFDDSWKVNATPSAGLEARDASVTPVKGRMAWFTLRDYQLAVDISRDSPVLDAEITAYALPQARNLEIEGQIALQVSHAPLREFEVAFPKDAGLPTKVAPLLRMDSPQIASQHLDEATGTWHFTLRRELQGVQRLRWHLSLPSSVSTGGREVPDGTQDRSPGHTELTATLPVLTVPKARHFSGQWVIEANTDTELKIWETKGTQPLDAQHPAPVEGYQPRHRVLAMYGYGLGDYSLRLTAIRHDPGALISAVVQQLTLTSVVSADGSSRHEADLRVQHNGLQFFALQLPHGARLLSATAGGAAIKPVRAGEDEVRVPLEAHAGQQSTATLSVLYEVPGHPLHGAGRLGLLPPSVDAAIPILTSSWRVYMPAGMEVRTEGGFADTALYARPQTLLMGLGQTFVGLLGPVYANTGHEIYALKKYSGTSAYDDAAPTFKASKEIIQGMEEKTVTDTPKAPPPKEPAKPEVAQRVTSQNNLNFKSGLISLELSPPINGQLLELGAHEKPLSLILTYQSWELQLRKAMLWMALGAGLYWKWGRRRPCLWTATAVAVLTLTPQVCLPTWMAAANALLAGWLVTLMGRVLWRMARWAGRLGSRFMPSAAGQLQPSAN